MISPHDLKDLREELVDKYKAKYWIGCDSRGRTLMEFVVPNVVAEFPMTYLVDVRGKVVDFGDKLEAKIEYLLEEVFDTRLGRDLHAGLRGARADYDKGAFGAAWKSAGLQLTSEDAQLAADAKFLRERCEAYGAWKKLVFEREMAAGSALPVILRDLRQTQKALRGMPMTAWLAEKRLELEKDPKVTMEAVLGAPFDEKLDRDLHAGLKTARRHYDKGAIGAAWKAAGAKLDNEDALLAGDAMYLRERCEEYGEWRRLSLQREIDRGAYPRAVPGLKDLAKAFRGMPTGDWASKTRRKLEKDPKVKLELKAWSRLEKVLAKAKKARGNSKKMSLVRKELRAIREAFPGTLAASEATRQLRN